MTFAVRPWVIGAPTVPLITYRDAWGNCQRALCGAVGNDAYAAWFSGLRFVEVDKRGRVLQLTVASAFLRRWIRCQYHELLLEICRAEWPTLAQIEVSTRSCVVRDLRSVPVLLLPAPKPAPVYARPRERYAPYTPGMLFPGHPDVAIPRKPGQFVEHIQRTVAEHYKVTRGDILSKRRTADVVRPRQVAMYLAFILTNRSLPELGRLFGGKDHTTVLHSINKVAWLIGDRKGKRPSTTRKLSDEINTALAEEVESLKRQLAV